MLGPILFWIDMDPLSELIDSFGTVKHLLYAENTQIHLSITLNDASNRIKEVQQCLWTVQLWMSANKLKLNADKTEFIVFGNKKHHAELASLFLLTFLAVPDLTVKNLGVKFDSCLNMSK